MTDAPSPPPPTQTSDPAPWASPLTTTVDDTALVFEGGGMRNAYTAAVVSALLAERIHLPHVSGISAGASHLCNYLSRDAERSHATFVDLVDDPQFGGLDHFRHGRGLFNAEYIYERICYPDGALPFRLDVFNANPAQARVAAFNATEGRTRWFTQEDMSTMPMLGAIVRASSTLPILMPPVVIDGDVYVDGALGENGGIALDAPMRDGYRKFLVILTRPRDYVKHAMRPAVGAAIKTAYRHLPSVYEGVVRRPARYNAVRRRLLQLEEQGRAYLFFPEALRIQNTEMHRDRLEAAYRAGMVQAVREMPAIKRFLGIS
ncbi:patatin family protein [Actinomyces sp. B33]|uniref:patatin-like phospholipase family protein n=1 Tax=Actinomyces sp. B33 TaxID=2942131 RepID=UPI0023420560|nr:patatin family protein [Actinomyces sp. B33]MDC4232592.1 patatin family protein [Actinomyces sp. B33]